MIRRLDSLDLFVLAFGQDPALAAEAEKILLEGTPDLSKDPTPEERSVSDAARPDG